MNRCDRCHRKMKRALDPTGVCLCGGRLEQSEPNASRGRKCVPGFQTDSNGAARYEDELRHRDDYSLNRFETAWMRARLKWKAPDQPVRAPVKQGK